MKTSKISCQTLNAAPAGPRAAYTYCLNCLRDVANWGTPKHVSTSAATLARRQAAAK